MFVLFQFVVHVFIQTFIDKKIHGAKFLHKQNPYVVILQHRVFNSIQHWPNTDMESPFMADRNPLGQSPQIAGDSLLLLL